MNGHLGPFDKEPPEERGITQEWIDMLHSDNPAEKAAAIALMHKLAFTLLELANHGE